MNKYLTVVAKFKAKAGKEDLLQETLMALVKPTHGEEGCVNYDLHRSTEDPGVFVFHENWTSEDLLNQHLRSPHVRKMIAASKDLVDGKIEIYKLKKIS